MGVEHVVCHSTESSLPASTPLTKRLTVHILAYRGLHLRPVPSPLRSLRFMDKEIRVKFTGGREGECGWVGRDVATQSKVARLEDVVRVSGIAGSCLFNPDSHATVASQCSSEGGRD